MEETLLRERSLEDLRKTVRLASEGLQANRTPVSYTHLYVTTKFGNVTIFKRKNCIIKQIKDRCKAIKLNKIVLFLNK